MFARELEPEVMDCAEEARDYDAMDHQNANASFCDDLLDFARTRGITLDATGKRLLDFGTGTARIPLELCAKTSHLSIVAIDLASHMLEIAGAHVASAHLEERVRLERVEGKRTPYADGSFDVAVSNSVAHHIPDPRELFAEMWRVTAPGGILFVRDLERPESREMVARLVAEHAGTPPADASLRAAYERQRELLRASLCAALTIPEVTTMLEALGVGRAFIQKTSDRHWTLACTKP